MIKNIFIINGIYDVLCALCILDIINLPIISNLHLSMIKTNQDKSYKRFFAYWIFTYGIMRLSNDNLIIAYSYIIEASFIYNEYLNDSVYENKAFFVIISSLLLALLSFLV